MDRFGGLPLAGANLTNAKFDQTLAAEAGVYEDTTPLEESDDPFEDQPIEDATIVNAFRKIWDIEDARFKPIKDKIAEAWIQYHMTWITPKDRDQSDRRFPLFLMYVEKMTGAFMQMINFKDKWLDITSTIPQHQVMTNVARRLATELIQNTDVKFIQKMAEAIKSGVVTGNILTQILPSRNKVASMTGAPAALTEEEMNGFFSSFQDIEKGDKPIVPNPLLPKIELNTIPFEQVRLDSSRGDRYVMWTQEVPIGTVFAEAADRGYDVEEIKKARDRRTWSMPADSTSTTEKTREGLGPDARPPSGMMRLHFFEGTMDDPLKGVRLFSNEILVIANGCRILLRAPIPFWDGERSGVHAKFIDPPHSVYGKGLGSENYDSFDVRNGMTNLLLDYMRRVLDPAYEEDQDMLDPEEVRKPRVMYPGAIIRKIDSNGRNVYTPVSPGELPAAFWNTYQAVDMQTQTTTGQDTGVGGAVRTRGRQTAQEYESRDAKQGALLDNIFRLMEASYLSPIIKLMYLRNLQYIPDAMWATWVRSNKKAFLEGTEQSNQQLIAEWDKVFEEMATWDAVKRYKFFGSTYTFNVKVFSNMAERQAMIEKVFFSLRSLSQVPGAIQELRLNRWIRKGTEAFGWDPEEMLRPEALSRPDLEGITTATQDDEAPEVPDLSQGAMGVLESGMQAASKPPAAGLFPGGPVNPTPNPVSPPPRDGIE